jgi:hypothetical protein
MLIQWLPDPKRTFPNKKEHLMVKLYTLYPKHYMSLPLYPSENLLHLLKPPNLITGYLQRMLSLMPCYEIALGNWFLHHAILISLAVAGFSRSNDELMV